MLYLSRKCDFFVNYDIIHKLEFMCFLNDFLKDNSNRQFIWELEQFYGYNVNLLFSLILSILTGPPGLKI